MIQRRVDEFRPETLSSGRFLRLFSRIYKDHLVSERIIAYPEAPLYTRLYFTLTDYCWNEKEDTGILTIHYFPRDAYKLLDPRG